MTKKYALVVFLFLFLIISTYYISSGVDGTVFEVRAVNSSCNYKVKEIKEEGKNYVIGGYIPDTEYEVLNKKVNNITIDYINDFKENIEGLTPLSEDAKFELQFTFNSYEMENYISFEIEIYSYTGGAHPNTLIETVVYNKKENNFVTIEDLEKLDNNILNKLSEYSYNKLKQNKILIEVNDEGMLKDGLKPDDENFDKFVFSDEGLIVFFERYSIAPYFAGDFSILVPYDVINLNI